MNRAGVSRAGVSIMVPDVQLKFLISSVVRADSNLLCTKRPYCIYYKVISRAVMIKR